MYKENNCQESEELLHRIGNISVLKCSLSICAFYLQLKGRGTLCRATTKSISDNNEVPAGAGTGQRTQSKSQGQRCQQQLLLPMGVDVAGVGVAGNLSDGT